MKALAIKNTKATNHTMVDEKPWSDSVAKSKVLVTVQQCKPITVITGLGSDLKTIPLMVPINIAKSCQPLGSIISGFCKK